MKKLQKTFCLLLSAALVASAFTGCGSDTGKTASDGAGSTTGTAGTDKKDPLKISITLSGNSNSRESMVEDAAQKLISEKMGRELVLDYNLVGGSEYNEKAKMLITSDDITDLFQLPEFYDYADAAGDGMFAELSSNKDKLPQYFGYVDKVQNGLAGITMSDGNVYILNGIDLPRFPADKGVNSQNVSTYRYDIFEKNNIPIPSTLDELYNAAKKLKELYPKEYPINTRWKDLRSLFYANHTTNDVYWNGEKYVLGLFDEGYKEAIQFANKLHSEGLLDPEYILETDV